MLKVSRDAFYANLMIGPIHFYFLVIPAVGSQGSVCLELLTSLFDLPHSAYRHATVRWM